MKKSIKKTKKELINVINKTTSIKITNKILIQELISDGALDNLIYKLNNEKVITLKSVLVPKGYLTGYEQFVCLLDNFITHIISVVDSPELIKTIIINCLNVNSNILLSKKYYYDVENISFYEYNYNYMITAIFYDNLVTLKDKLTKELDIIGLYIDKINIEDKNDIHRLTSIIEEIVLVNKSDYKLLSLFTKVNFNRYNLFLDWYSMLINKYQKNKNFIIEYRKLRNSSLI